MQRNAAQGKTSTARTKFLDAKKAYDEATSSAEKATALEARRAAYAELLDLGAERDTAQELYVNTRQYAEDLKAAVELATGDVIGISMCQITSILSGGISKAIATLAIFAVAIGLFMGKVNWSIAFLTSAGIAIIFNISAILGFITGGSGASNPCIIAG